MAQLFHRSTNTIAKVSILCIVAVLAFVPWIPDLANRTSYMVDVNLVKPQPVPFSHKHHVTDDGLDCRYCHTSVEVSAFAGIPPIKTCMTCHSQIWTQAPVLEPIRASFRTNVPIQWTRVHDLPDFVYFNHSIHIHKGVGCETCHGHVDQMPLMRKVHTLNMDWCINCHRHPERYVRPRDQVFNMHYQPPADQIALGERLVKEYNIGTPRKLTSCSTCHR